jgi:hypothetical protein
MITHSLAGCFIDVSINAARKSDDAHHPQMVLTEADDGIADCSHSFVGQILRSTYEINDIAFSRRRQSINRQVSASNVCL